MTLYDLIMGKALGDFTKSDWASLGRGDITDNETINKMLADGYGAIANED